MAIPWAFNKNGKSTKVRVSRTLHDLFNGALATQTGGVVHRDRWHVEQHMWLNQSVDGGRWEHVRGIKAVEIIAALRGWQVELRGTQVVLTCAPRDRAIVSGQAKES